MQNIVQKITASKQAQSNTNMHTFSKYVSILIILNDYVSTVDKIEVWPEYDVAWNWVWAHQTYYCLYQFSNQTIQ